MTWDSEVLLLLRSGSPKDVRDREDKIISINSCQLLSLSILLVIQLIPSKMASSIMVNKTLSAAIVGDRRRSVSGSTVYA